MNSLTLCRTAMLKNTYFCRTHSLISIIHYFHAANVPKYIETSQLIFTVNQLTGFYIVGEIKQPQTCVLAFPYVASKSLKNNCEGVYFQ